MDLVRLRTLTRKSKIGYGKFKDQTVGELLDANYKKELAWLYYNVQWITFMPDILEELKIIGKWAIEKPGTDPIAYKKRGLLAFASKVGMDKALLCRYNRQKKKARKLEKEHSQDISKSRLQAMNHGHIGKL